MNAPKLCSRCRRPAKPGRTRCADCTAKAAGWNRARYEKRKAEGLCPHCGGKRLLTKTECGDCRGRKFRQRLKLLRTESRKRMSWTISIALASPRHLYVVLKGRFDLAEFSEMFAQVCELKQKHPRLPILFSDLEFDVGRMKRSELISVRAEFVYRDPVLASTKIAIVMGSESDLALADKWKSITQPDSAATFKIFRNERKARKWLA